MEMSNVLRDNSLHRGALFIGLKVRHMQAETRSIGPAKQQLRGHRFVACRVQGKGAFTQMKVGVFEFHRLCVGQLGHAAQRAHLQRVSISQAVLASGAPSKEIKR